MSFEEVPYLRRPISPPSLFDIAAVRVCIVHTQNDINTGYLNGVIPRMIYDILLKVRDKVKNPLKYHDWSVSKRLPIHMHNMLTAWCPEDGIPDFVYEYNYLKVQYVEIDVVFMPNIIRHCLPCYNSYSRHYFADEMVEMYFIQRAVYEFGEDLMTSLQMLNQLWCHRCITQPLFVIRESTHEAVTRHWPFNVLEITRRQLHKRN